MSTTTPTRMAAVVSPAPRDVWTQVYESDRHAVVSQSPQWSDCLSRESGWKDASRLYQLEDGRRLVLPLAARSVGGVRVLEESWPYSWGYGGLLAEGGDLGEQDVRVVLADLRDRLGLRTTITPMPMRAGLWSQAAGPGVGLSRYCSEVVDLSGGFDAVWVRFRKAVRNAHRAAERRGVEVLRDTTGRFAPDFARLYASSVERWASEKGQPLALARALARRRDRAGQAAAVMQGIPEECVTWVATWRGEVVAVNVVLLHGDFVHGWLGVTDRELNRVTRGGMLLDSRVIQDACEKGVRFKLFGESEPDSPVERYKRQFGGHGVDACTLRMERVPLTPVLERSRSAVEALLARRAGRSEGQGKES
jgi:CelD/BcsL family acetyltransferase involved in cellulose biosynthesis